MGSTEPLSASCCIYGVPPSLRKVNEKDYTPNYVSIGPFHNRNKRLKSRQQLKLWYLHQFLKRTQKDSFDHYVLFLEESEDKIRRCYSETIEMESSQFVSMILIDAGFIIELFLAFSEDQSSVDDPIVRRLLWPIYDIIVDLILVENQLPFFVLEDIFHQTFPDGFKDKLSFLDLTIPIFVSYLSANLYYIPSKGMFDQSTFPYREEHLCDVLRAICLPSNPPERIRYWASLKRSYSVSQLYESGVKLQAHPGKKLTEVLFSEGVLTIPRIRVSNLTEKLLRNVVAFEQCHYPLKHYVTDYIVLLDFLIQSVKDVEILAEKGNMESYLDSDAVASMLSNLRKHVVEISVNSDYASLHKGLHEFYNDPRHEYKAIFVREYWSTPWKKASSFAAVLLLFLTLIQTISSIIPLFNK
ncbi:UPF0481 protein At3g47200-like [Neltuma alba]|uniref:UPF0481 protein At3g47200-like n=1 Tax=Neltuma alba TaxID=207710 RepID=UPI0010A384FC|nr:UPF0481 protein At3g47200-like [Prosopis alba]